MLQPKYLDSLYPGYLRVKGNLDNTFFKKSVPKLYFISNFKKFNPNFRVVRKHSCLGRSYAVSYLLSTINSVVIYLVKCIRCINAKPVSKKTQFSWSILHLQNIPFSIQLISIKRIWEIEQKQWIVFLTWDVLSF